MIVMDLNKTFNDKLNIYRDELDTLDSNLIGLIARRVRIIEKVGALKKKHSVAMMQPDRVRQVYQTRGVLARQHAVDDVLIKKIFDVLLQYSFVREVEIIDKVERG